LVAAAVIGGLAAAAEKTQAPPAVTLKHDDAAGRFDVLVGGKPAVVYHHGAEVDLPHYVLFSPSGKPLTVQKTEPYPHHRSFWFADTVQLAGQRKASFYNALYSQVDKKDPKSPFRDRIRHVAFAAEKAEGHRAEVELKLVWEMDLGKTPVLEETRKMRIAADPQGQYFVDVQFTLAAAHGDVEFQSDAVHYAWPFIRIHPTFSGQQGATITSSEGKTGEKATNMQPALWVDYSNTVDGATEGLALMSYKDNPGPHRWLTREYGTFGPRRPDDRSGKPFTLKRGETLTTRAGVWVHGGDVQGGRVAARYQQWTEGKP
jgi:hypothetical protein